MWIAELREGPLHGETTRIIEAYRRLHMPIPRERGWPCEFAIYQLDRKEVRPFTHRYRFQAVRRASYDEKLLFDGGRHNWVDQEGRMPTKFSPASSAAPGLWSALPTQREHDEMQRSA